MLIWRPTAASTTMPSTSCSSSALAPSITESPMATTGDDSLGMAGTVVAGASVVDTSAVGAGAGEAVAAGAVVGVDSGVEPGWLTVDASAEFSPASSDTAVGGFWLLWFTATP